MNFNKTVEVEEQNEGKLYIDGDVFITDPCYDEDTWCTANATLDAGIYDCYTTNYDGRVSSMFIIKEDYDDDCVYEDDEDRLTWCGVDSGQLGFFNRSKYNKPVSEDIFNESLKHPFPYEDWKRKYDVEDSFYLCCSNHTLCENLAGVIEGVGFVSASGYGDGSYQPRYLYDKQGNTIGIKIDFITVLE